MPEHVAILSFIALNASQQEKSIVCTLFLLPLTIEYK